MVEKLMLAIRVDPAVFAQLDALAAKLSKRAAGASITRSDAARLAIERGIAAIETELAKKK